MARLTQAASSMRIMTVVRRFSQMRGTAKKYVGPTSFRSCSTVPALSGQFTVKPSRMDCE